MKKRFKCQWCISGEMVQDDERKAIGHSAPQCDGVVRALHAAQLPPALFTTTDLVVDENGA